jgi:hypothetical protein
MEIDPGKKKDGGKQDDADEPEKPLLNEELQLAVLISAGH